MGMVNATVPADGTIVRVKAGMPGVSAGTRAVVRHESPNGLSNLKSGMVWLELDAPILWSHGASPHAGYWATPVEFDVDQVDERWPGMPDPHRHNPLAVAVVLAVFFGIAWACVAGVVLAMIAGVL
jgi:hypothetical protein